eukprot:6142867-Prymnesium_polylepis.1
MDDKARVALLSEALERLGQAHQRRRQSIDAPPADPEAIFLDAVSAVKPITDNADGVSQAVQ